MVGHPLRGLKRTLRKSRGALHARRQRVPFVELWRARDIENMKPIFDIDAENADLRGDMLGPGVGLQIQAF